MNGESSNDQRVYTVGNGAQAGAAKQIRVVLVEDEGIVREAIALLLDRCNGIEVVGTAGNGREAIELASQLQPDVVLMDLSMPGMNGIEATRQVRKRSPHSRVLLLTGYAEDDQIIEGLRAGISGCVVKRADVPELVLAIQTVRRGNSYFSEALSLKRSAMDFITEASKQPRLHEEPLTAREREVLQLVAEGFQNQAIAAELFISVKTVEAHKAHIKAKLDASSDMDLLRHAVRRGIVSLESRGSDGRGRDSGDSKTPSSA